MRSVQDAQVLWAHLGVGPGSSRPASLGIVGPCGHKFCPLTCAFRNLTWLMLCKCCGDELEDTNRYACTMGAKVYLSNTCRPCKRTQAVCIYHLRKRHPQPPSGSPCDCCGRIDKLQLDHAHGGTCAWRGFLCRQCNVGIGHLGDSSEGVAKALAYLAAAKERESRSVQSENGLVATE